MAAIFVQDDKVAAVNVATEMDVSPEVSIGEAQTIASGTSHLQRKLGGKEVQLFAMGGAIGTSVFITISQWLPHGGPAGLFLAYSIWGFNVCCVNECFSEMTCYAPVPSCFPQFTSFWVDEALAFTQSWAFFVCQALLVPAEITAFHILITFWTDKMPVEATIIICLVLYGLLNCISVKWFGKAEFWLSIGKVFLILLCFGFTFFTMIGVNPLHDAYGFRYWNNPGAFAEYLAPGSLGRFWGFLSCMGLASFAICGPEYTASVAGECKTPRRIMPACFSSFKWRLGFFFVGSALCIGIVVPYNDPTLLAYIDGTVSGGGTSRAVPYVIAMERLKISGLPHLVNAVMMTSVFSCGNGVLYAASRALFVMGQAGRAPKFLTKTTKRGIPIYSVLAVMCIGLLAFLQVSDRGSEVLHYFVDLCTITGQWNYMCTCIAYIHFYNACKKQGLSRDSLPYKSPFQPYAAYLGIAGAVSMMLLLGFDILSPFEIKWFFLDYTLLAVLPIMAIVWKFVRKTKYHRAEDADLTMGGAVKEVDEYEDLVHPEPEGWVERLFSGVWEWSDLGNLIRRKQK